MRLTVGPLPSAVYWRRRAFVLGAVLLVLFLVAQACMAASASPDGRGGGDAGQTTTSPSPTSTSATPTTPLPSVAPPSEPAGTPVQTEEGDRCSDDEMLITAEAEQTSFPAGTSVQFTIRIQNDSGRTCVRDVGPDQRELYLRRSNGAGRLWSSRACTDLAGQDVRELPPTFASSHWIVWNGRASGLCEGTEPAGDLLEPGEYELVARLGTAYSEPVAITLG